MLSTANLRVRLLTALQTLFKLVSRVTKGVFGYSLHSGCQNEKTRSGKEILRSAHRMRVLYRATPNSVCLASMKWFLLGHDSYEDPFEAVASDNGAVSLMAVEDNGAAVFAVVMQRDVFSKAVGPFCFQNQMKHCHQIVTVPVKFLVQMVERLPKPTAKVLISWTMGRCGGTLIMSALGRLPRSVCVSEPDAFSCLLARSLRSICMEGDVRPSEVAGAVVAFVCHAAANAGRREDTELIVIKPRNLAMSSLNLVLESSPYVLHGFNYRQPFACALSRASIARAIYPDSDRPSEPWFRDWMMNVLVNDAYELDCIPEESVDAVGSIYRRLDECYDEITQLALYAGIFFLYYEYFRSTGGVDFLLMSYDSLVANPAVELSSWVDWLGPSPTPDLVASCVQAMSSDSQEGTSLARKCVASRRKTVFSREEEDAMWSVFEAMGLCSNQLFREACGGKEVVDARRR